MKPNDVGPEGRFGRINLLPAMTFEMPADPNVTYGKADTPVNVLPPHDVDLTDPALRPALQLVFHPRPDVAPLLLSLDLFRLYSALNELERSLGGEGLTLEEQSVGPAPSNGDLKVTFTLTAIPGAVDRVNHLVRAINKGNLAGELTQRSLNRCEARFTRAA